MTSGADRTGRLLVGLTLAVLAAFQIGVSLQHLPVMALRHALFASGVLPLILGAMLYFVPVLTRSLPAHGAILSIPPTAFVLGAGVVLALSGHADAVPLLAAGVQLLVCIEIAWILRRRARVLGAPHPGIDWYVYALIALVVALAMIVSRAFWPEHWGLARNLHLHLNLFGFLGLTAIGTLRVLLPTALGETDPASALFLRRQLPIAASGALAIAFGAAFWKPLAVLGALAWLWSVFQLLRAMGTWRGRWLLWHAASTSLAAAVLGWALLLLAGMAHAAGYVTSDALFAVLIFGFLLPLVTGATSHLLPVWRWPGRATSAQAQMRQRLTRFSAARVGAFWLSAAAGLAGWDYAVMPGALALALYLVQVLLAFVRVRGVN
jgi:hypothetical protein